MIHSATYYNSFKITEILINFFKKSFGTYLRLKYLKKNNLPRSTATIERKEIEAIKRQVQRIVKDWVNFPTKSKEDFQAMHFASYHGNPKMIKLLEANGADIYAKNLNGLGVLHVAAQSDQAFSLTYFKKRGLNMKDRDKANSTPLHWACQSGADTAIYYLLAWDAEVNEQDSDLNTPLHLAI
mmetsp:Transcript_16093/g.11610  ORF Transcript_16093/g.11610 Transcript_16093/m.11610 type:complete len:183 (+) Transcript_16093:370-918(+)